MTRKAKLKSATANSTKSNTICSVVNCTNTPANCEGKVPKVTFHRFPSKPQDVDRKRLWVRFTKRQTIDGKDWQPKPWSLICSEHFFENKPVNHPQHRGYEPLYYKENVNSSQRIVITTKVSTDNCRFERSLKRATKFDNDVLPAKIAKYDQVDHWSGNEEPLPSLTPPPPPKYCEIGTQTEEGPEDLANKPKGRMHFFISNNNNQDLSTQVIHDDEPVPPVERVERGVGNSSDVPCFFGYGSIELKDQNEAKLELLTTVTISVFKGLLKALEKSGYKPRVYRSEDLLLLFLIRLKHALSFGALSVFFNMKQTTVRDNFFHILNRLYLATRSVIYWPSREDIFATLPECFRTSRFSSCRVIIDCFEIKCDKLASIKKANEMYSTYKSGHTVKVLIAIAPNGLITFLSPAYGGRASDVHITNFSGLLDLLSPGDTVLADKGFPMIKNEDILTVIPPRKDKKQVQFTAALIAECEDIASLRINVERVIQRLRIFSILKHQMHHTMLPHVNKILHLCAVLVNLQPKIFKSKECQNNNDEAQHSPQFEPSVEEFLDTCLFDTKQTENKESTSDYVSYNVI